MSLFVVTGATRGLGVALARRIAADILRLEAAGRLRGDAVQDLRQLA